ncbi:alpha/beta fold hydrolase [Streptomyces hebeiensis]|uniref:Alpha/beta fold hydrolase n=1 Tax=Streptomyces hebeiensis TaxID=229486 RepID=A0ABN1UGU4_9ACTN
MTTVRNSFRDAYDAVLQEWPGPVAATELSTPYGLTRVNSTGPADAPPLVLLPGGRATSTVWGACAAGLGRNHRVHAVDLMGDPGLSAPAGGRRMRSVADLVAWLDAVLDGLDRSTGPAGPVELAGHSYGAWIAAHYAVHAPRRLRQLVLLDPTQVFAGFRPGYVLRALPMLARPTPRRIRTFLTWESGGAFEGAAPEGAVHEGAVHRGGVREDGGLDVAWLRLQEASAGFPAVRPVTGPRPDTARLDGTGVPVLALFAGRARCHDAVRVARAAAAALPGALVDVVPGASHHTLPLTAADEITRLMTSRPGSRPADGPS